jgi:hypothetical protein
MNVIEYNTNVRRVDSKNGIVARLLIGELKNLIDAKDKRFSSYSKASKTDSCAHEVPYSVGAADNSPPSGTEIEYLHSPHLPSWHVKGQLYFSNTNMYR